MRLPLIDGHGNFVLLTVTHQQQCYTEARLARSAMEMLAELRTPADLLQSNYDESLTEPSKLFSPARFLKSFG